MTAADALTVTHTSTVTAERIDHLGHMNVRYYAIDALAATQAFVGPGKVVDLYTRHHREQLLGAELEVRSGTLDIAIDTGRTDTGSPGGSIRVYHELADSMTGEIAATFVHVVRHDGPGEPLDTPAGRSATTDIPDHGRPRSIDLDAMPAEPTLDELQRLGLAMRSARTLDHEDTGGLRTVPPDLAPMLFWGGVPVDGEELQLLHVGPGGENIAWATLETRVMIDRIPTLGTRIQSFGAPTAIGDKTLQTSMWVHDLDDDPDNGPIASFEIVSIMFDIDARRACSIPEVIRADQVVRFHPELASSVRSV